MTYEIREATCGEYLFRITYHKKLLNNEEGEVYVIARNMDYVLGNVSRYIELPGGLDSIEIVQLANRVNRIVKVE